MERYTYFDGGKWRMRVGDAEYSGKETDRLAAYEETGLEPEELAQAKKKGRLVVLPCDVGDKLYDVTLGEVREKIVISLSMLLSKSVNHLVIHAENFRNAVTSYELQDIGKTVFLTREAAEATLDAMRGENNA
ncbi:hypothetical protein JXX16_00755 [Ruthenibacterium lactatiformans]|uniref:hypothetical protein n=1 Tax=Ruthenibacterium lactatiformans TaxID=1550024 RepID=UPI00196742D2|nr:hypothetical protein [Ruthenibacterium lactatiformans]MBN3018682.1 hypothetical protein [Ruthenibacterium lactatiformans]